MESRTISAVIMDLNLSHRRFKIGLAKNKLKHYTLIPVVLGRMVILKVFTAVFATNV